MPRGVYKRTPEMLAAVEAGRACASKRRPPTSGIRCAETGEVMTTTKQVREYWRKKHGESAKAEHPWRKKNG